MKPRIRFMDRLDMLLHILSHFTHQFDWLPLELDSVCGVVDCSCEIDDESESESEFISEEEDTYMVKRIAQTLGASLYTSEAAGWHFWRMCCDLPISTFEWALSAYKGSLDARLTADGFSPILMCIANVNWNAVEAFAKHGADLHYVGKDIDYSPVEETVTSLSLYSSRRFFEWRDILRDLKI